MSSSTKIDNRKKDVLIPGKGPTRELEHTLSAEKLYSIILGKKNEKKIKKACKENSYLIVNDTEIIKFKSKDPEILPHPLCLGNIWKDWSIDNMKNTGFNGYVYHFSVNYDAITVDDILDIHKYLMKKNSII